MESCKASGSVRCDVVVVGAGPAGSRVARLLKERGHSVLLIEKNAVAGKGSACGGLLSEKWFSRVAADDTLIQQHIVRTEFVFPWGIYTDQTPLVTVRRSEFDPALARSAAAAGVDFITGCKVSGVSREPDGNVRVTAHYHDGHRMVEVLCRCCIAADGPFSAAHAMKPFRGANRKRHWSFAVAVELDGEQLDENTCRIYLDPQLIPRGYGWIFPYKGKLNAGIGTTLSSISRGCDIQQKLDYFLNHYPLSAGITKGRRILRKQGGMIPMSPLKKVSDGPLALIGDAAGMVSPIFGAGIDNALEAAELLAKTVSDSIKGAVSPADLSKYDGYIGNTILKRLAAERVFSRALDYAHIFSPSLPAKLLSVLVFGGEYSRLQKIRILLHPLLGLPVKRSGGS